MKIKVITKERELKEIENEANANVELEKVIDLIKYLDLTSNEFEHDLYHSMINHIRTSQKFRES